MKTEPSGKELFELVFGIPNPEDEQPSTSIPTDPNYANFYNVKLSNEDDSSLLDEYDRQQTLLSLGYEEDAIMEALRHSEKNVMEQLALMKSSDALSQDASASNLSCLVT